MSLSPTLDPNPTIPVHKVKLAVQIGSGAKAKYVVECVCGWSSPIHWTQPAANQCYAKHRGALPETEANDAHRDVYPDGTIAHPGSY